MSSYVDRNVDHLVVRTETDPGVPGSVRMVLSGDVDAVTADELLRAVIEVLRRQRPACIDIDLAQVGFLDSAGVRGVLVCKADAAQLNCEIRLHDPQPDVCRVLRILGLLDMVHTGAHPRRGAYRRRSLTSVAPLPAGSR